MRGVALWFFASGVVYVTAGMVFGIWMSASGDHSLGGAHAHLNLVGWVTMALFGVFYHFSPAAAGTRLAMLHFIVATLGVWLLVPGIALAIKGMTVLPATIGSFLTLASRLIFLWTVVTSGSRTGAACARQRREIRLRGHGFAAKDFAMHVMSTKTLWWWGC